MRHQFNMNVFGAMTKAVRPSVRAKLDVLKEEIDARDNVTRSTDFT